MTRGWALLAVLLALAGPTACSHGADGADAGPGKTFIVAGTVRLAGQPGVHSGQPCAGAGADADLHNGASVTVSGPDGRTLGIGPLTDGTGAGQPDGTIACVWTFFVPDVSADSDAYQVEVTDRGRHSYDPSAIHGRVDILLSAR